MATAELTFTEEVIETAGLKVQVRKGGSGTPLLVIHGELGVPGWLEAYDELAKRHSVVVPSLPGYGGSETADWLASPRDMAAWITWFVRDQGMSEPIDVVGVSLGGWLAAEIATFNACIFRKMVLVGPAGLKPEKGETWDYFLNSGHQAFERSFHRPTDSNEYRRFYGGVFSAEEEETIEGNREMTARLTWKPYMRSHTLGGLLGGVRTPTLIVWGREDRIIPVVAGEQYQRAIPGSRLAVMEGCGHSAEMENPAEFARIVEEFLGGS